MKTVDLIYHEAGGGHCASVTALRDMIVSQGRPWQVRMVNLQELLDPIDLGRKLTGRRIQDIYALILNNGMTLGATALLRVLQTLIRIYHRPALRLVEKHWRESQPDIVVSLVPHFNRVLCESVRNAQPGVPFVNILTDIADFPPRFWIERQDQYLICGSQRAVEQARALGHSPERIFSASGMIIHPRFYEPLRVERRAERQKLSLDPERLTGLVMFGGQGSPVIGQIADRLDGSGLDLQLILICGRNENQAANLRGRKFRMPVRVEAYTRETPYFMYLSDFFIGKPGPGSLREALAMGLPVIVERNAWTLPQERYNTEWIKENEVGVVVRNFREIVAAVKQLFAPDQFQRFRANAKKVKNRAVFEIPEILAKILESSQAS